MAVALSGMRATGAALSAAMCASACAAPVPAATSGLVQSLPEAPESVVAIENARDTIPLLCSGVLLAPRVVLTARHCVQRPGDGAPDAASLLRVVPADDVRGGTSSLAVVEVVTVPGTLPESGVATDGNDLALLVLESGRPGVPAAPLHLGTPTALLGDPVRVAGYGGTETSGPGERRTAAAIVRGATDSLLVIDPVACAGDSGGPVFTDAGEVVGVVSFGPDACASSSDAGRSFTANAVWSHLAWIEAVLERVPACTADGAEQCDDADNDCDDVVDEGCAAIGAPCTNDGECDGGQCASVGGDRICTIACDPSERFACGEGARCASEGSSCGGQCVPVERVGSGRVGDPCSAPEDCETLVCSADPAGRMRCAVPCREDRGDCLYGEVCDAGGGGCGSCWAATEGSGESLARDRGLGEPCELDDECRSGRCSEGDVSVCSHACTDDVSCPASMRCEGGSCVLGAPGAAGDRCAADRHCGAGLECVEGRCAHRCSEGCAADFECVDGYCVTRFGAPGDSCESSLACLSGRCVEGVCATRCSSTEPCSAGLVCIRDPSGQGGLCRPRPPATGGCSVVRGGGRESAVTLLALLGLTLVSRSAARRWRTSRSAP